MCCFNVGWEVFDQKTGLDDKAHFRRIDVPFTTGQFRSDRIRLFTKPSFYVDDGPRSHNDDGVALKGADHNVGEVVGVEVYTSSEGIAKSSGKKSV